MSRFILQVTWTSPQPSPLGSSSPDTLPDRRGQERAGKRSSSCDRRGPVTVPHDRAGLWRQDAQLQTGQAGTGPCS